MKSTAEAGEERGEEDVGDECHDWDIHVWGIKIVAGREEVIAVGSGVLGARSGGGALLAGPGFMAPGEKDEEKLAEDVGGCNVEVVFQSADGDVAVYLC